MPIAPGPGPGVVHAPGLYAPKVDNSYTDQSTIREPQITRFEPGPSRLLACISFVACNLLQTTLLPPLPPPGLPSTRSFELPAAHLAPKRAVDYSWTGTTTAIIAPAPTPPQVRAPTPTGVAPVQGRLRDYGWTAQPPPTATVVATLPAGSLSFDAVVPASNKQLQGWSSTQPIPFNGGAAPAGQAAYDLPPRAAAPTPQAWTASPFPPPAAIVPLPAGAQTYDAPPRAAPRVVQDWSNVQPMPFTGGAPPVGSSQTEYPPRTRPPIPQDFNSGAAPIPRTGGAAPAGSTALDQLYRFAPRAVDYTWTASPFPPPAAVVPLPAGASSTDLPPRSAPRAVQDWTGTQPMPFTGGAAPVGSTALDLAPRGAAPVPQAWVNAVPQLTPVTATSLLPGTISTDLPPRAAPRLPDYTWISQSPDALQSGQLDPYYADVALLVTGATPFADTSGNRWPVTNTSSLVTANSTTRLFQNTSIDTSGNAAAALTASGSAVLNFGNVDFTLEAWVYMSSAPAAFGGVVTKEWTTALVDGFAFGYYTPNSKFEFFASATPGTLATNWDITNPFTDAPNGGGGVTMGALSLNAWHHVAVTRQGSTWRGFVDGVQGFSFTSTQQIHFTNNPVVIGNGGDKTNNWPGQIDQVRITTGVARYTGNFAVPTAPFLAQGAPLAPSITDLAPRAAARPVQDWLQAPVPVAPVVPLPPGASTTDLAPRAAPRPVQDWISVQPMPYTGGAAPVGASVLDLSPRAPAPVPQAWINQIPQLTPVTATALNPGAIVVELPPRAAQRPVQDWSSTQPMPFTGGAAPVGKAAYDLPPRGATPVPQAWTYTAAQLTPVTPPPPGAIVVDLPPRAPARGQLEYTSTQPMPFTGGTAPVGKATYDRPPYAAPRSIDALTWTQQYQQVPIPPIGVASTALPPYAPPRSIDALTWTQKYQITPVPPAGAQTTDLPPRAPAPVPQAWIYTQPMPFTGGAAPVGKVAYELPPRAPTPVPQAFIGYQPLPALWKLTNPPPGKASYDLPPRGYPPKPQDWQRLPLVVGIWTGYQTSHSLVVNAENRLMTVNAESRIMTVNAEQRVLTVPAQIRSS